MSTTSWLVVTIDDDGPNQLFVTAGEPGASRSELGTAAGCARSANSRPRPRTRSSAFVLDTRPRSTASREYDGRAHDDRPLGGERRGAGCRCSASTARRSRLGWAFVPGSHVGRGAGLRAVAVPRRRPRAAAGDAARRAHRDSAASSRARPSSSSRTPTAARSSTWPTARTTTLELASADLADHVYPGRITMLDESRATSSRSSRRQVEDGRNVRSSVLAEVDAAGELGRCSRRPTETSLIREYCVSPNGQYVAVARLPRAAIPTAIRTTRATPRR